MTQFHEGQDVEVCSSEGLTIGVEHSWRKAEIVGAFPGKLPEGKSRLYYVQFPDGTRAVFDAEHIRAVSDQEIIASTIEAIKY